MVRIKPCSIHHSTEERFFAISIGSISVNTFFISVFAADLWFILSVYECIQSDLIFLLLFHSVFALLELNGITHIHKHVWFNYGIDLNGRQCRAHSFTVNTMVFFIICLILSHLNHILLLHYCNSHFTNITTTNEQHFYAAQSPKWCKRTC